MGVFSPLVLVSEVNGKVVDSGKPVAGAKVVLRVDWSDNDANNVTKSTVTGEDGTFHFDPTEYRAGLHRLSLSQPVIKQFIYIEHNGTRHVAWEYVKYGYEGNSELGGKNLMLDCDLARKPESRGSTAYPYFGICVVK